MKEKLLAKLNELLEKRNIAKQNHDNTKALEQHEYRVEQDVLIDTIKKLQLYFAMACPEDKKEEMHSILEKIQRAKFGDDAKFQRFKLGTQNHPDVKSEYEKKFYMFFYFPTPLIEDGGLYEFFEKVGDYLDEESLDKVIQDIDNYKSPYIHNVKVYFWRDRIDALKKKNEERVEDTAKRQDLNDELESIANLVVTSDRNYSATNGDIRDQVLTKIGNDRMEAANKQSLTDGKYNHLNKYFCTSDTKNDGTRSIHEVRIGDVNIAKDFNLDQAKMIIPEDRQNAIKEVFKYMREKGIFDDNANTNEGGKKYMASLSFMKLIRSSRKR